MNGLVKWEPMQDLLPRKPLRTLGERNFEDVFEDLREFMEPFKMRIGRRTFGVQAYHKNGKYVIKADLPGIDAKDLHVTMEGDCLIIQGECKKEKERKGKTFRSKELFYGSFQQSIPLPQGLKAQDIKAKYHNGVLEIAAPVKRAQLPREIKIETKKEEGTEIRKAA